MSARAPSAQQCHAEELMQLDGLRMLGHNQCGADRQVAATFAALMGMQRQFDDAALVHFANVNDAQSELV